MRIFERKFNKLPPPYSDDSILSTYRFCNIYREFDRQTIFFHTLLKPYEDNFPLWLLNMLFCRSICRTETIENVGLLSFNKSDNVKVYEKLLTQPSPKYGTAYIFPISVILASQWNTREKLFCRYYPTVAKKLTEIIDSFDDCAVSDAIQLLLPVLGFPLKFLLTEVLIDVAYHYPSRLNLYKSFPVGPGSIPTMRRLAPNQKPEETVLQLATSIHPAINIPTWSGKPVLLSAENWEGIGCEFRKYTNLRHGLGRRRYYAERSQL